VQCQIIPQLPRKPWHILYVGIDLDAAVGNEARSGLRETIALLERAQQTGDFREASKLIKRAADILTLVKLLVRVCVRARSLPATQSSALHPLLEHLRPAGARWWTAGPAVGTERPTALSRRGRAAPRSLMEPPIAGHEMDM